MSHIGFCPPGVVFPFAGSASPDGWLLCDGSAVSRTTYAALFATIGSAWGYGDNSTTFNLPDMRGRFPRGRDAGIARDPDRASRTAANTGGNTGDNVGSVQVEATKKNGLTASTGITDPTHFHNGYEVPTGCLLTIGVGSVAGQTGLSAPGFNNGNNNMFKTDYIGKATGITATTTIGAGDSETRPLNANVNYIIKI
jgi:microcystin-dependent protein